MEHEQERTRYWGRYMGYIRDDADPQNRGRLRVFCPEVMGDVDEKGSWLDWALPNFPWFASFGVGFNFIPPKTNDWAVWVEFRHGDVRFPVWTGVFPLVEVNKDFVELAAKTKVLLGRNADEPMVLGNEWKTLQETVLQALIEHTHPTGVGPSGPPLPPQLTTFTQMLQSLASRLSTYIFGKKDPDES